MKSVFPPSEIFDIIFDYNQWGKMRWRGGGVKCTANMRMPNIIVYRVFCFSYLLWSVWSWGRLRRPFCWVVNLRRSHWNEVNGALHSIPVHVDVIKQHCNRDIVDRYTKMKMVGVNNWITKRKCSVQTISRPWRRRMRRSRRRSRGCRRCRRRSLPVGGVGGEMSLFFLLVVALH